MILAIASGKGGTGKTTLAVNLARAMDSSVQLLDCDVEAPNDHLFLLGRKIREEIVTVPIPQVNESLCNHCGECSQFCAYHAIVTTANVPIVFKEMCHGCGGCMKVCPQQAIHEINNRIGTIETIEAGNITLQQGRMDVGVAMAPPLIKKLKSHLQSSIHSILDAPPGTSCPVIATLRGVDFVLLVTEPTPFGLHDLRLAIDMVRSIGVPFGVVINRVGIGDDRVHSFCAQESIPVFLEIPDDRRIAEAYSRGKLIVDEYLEYKELLKTLLKQIIKTVPSSARTPL